jgi:hypothetical protein
MYRFEKIFKKTDPSALEEEIHRVLALMAKIDDPTDERYQTLNDMLVSLHKLKESETSHKRVSRDQILAATVHLVGIVAIINYERIHVVTSKAGSMVLKSFNK